MKKSEEAALEKLWVTSRWLLVPFFGGLIIVILVLLLRFAWDLWDLLKLSNATGADTATVIVHSISLVDTALIASLLLIIAFSGYRNSVSKINYNHEDSYVWQNKLGFSDLKIQLIGVMVAISGLELLRESTKIGFDGDIDPFTVKRIVWKIAIHITFVVSALLFSITDRLVERKSE